MAINQTYGEYLRKALLFLDNQYTYQDLQFLIMRYKKWNLTEFLAKQQQIVTADDQQWLDMAIAKLQKNYPLQYLFGYELFFDREFIVNEHTLIPRPETEWIVDYILQNEHLANQKIADIGTGSGVIGLTLKLEEHSAAVTITDIDEQTLAVAKQNASHLQADVQFMLGDNLQALDTKYDIIVSNPPYIAETEKDVMDVSVIQYEPHQALFADHHGLSFYEQFVALLPHYLHDDGRVYLEIGYKQGTAVAEMLQKQFPNKEIQVLKDYNNNERLVVMK